MVVYCCSKALPAVPAVPTFEYAAYVISTTAVVLPQDGWHEIGITPTGLRFWLSCFEVSLAH